MILGIFWALFFVFLWPLLALQKSFILSDYSVQHLPWAWHYFQSLQKGSLPYWTNQMACGFPFFAEGQVGPIYLLNLLSYKFLPFMAAYTWSLPFHMALGGVSMYFYARSLGISREGSGVAAVCLTFGSGFAGLFYNTGSLRTLAWLPLCLMLLEKGRRNTGGRQILCYGILAVVFSQQWLAGFPQMAVYSFGYCLLHEGWACFAGERREAKPRGAAPLFSLCLALAVGTFLALPQLVSTFELIGLSVRQGESVHFALWGSVPPAAIASLLFPQWGNWLRVSFYAGTIPLFFILALVFLGKPFKTGVARHAALAVLFFLLALGKFNPLYRWLIEAFSLSFMRNPSKFLFFSVTSLGALAGFGFDRILLAREKGESGGRCHRALALAAFFFAALPLAGFLAVKAGEPLWEQYSRWYIAKLIAEKGASAKPVWEYLRVMDDFFNGLPGLFSYASRFNLNTIALAAASWVAVTLFLKARIRSKTFIFLITLLLAWDFYFFARFMGTGFLGNAGEVSILKPTAEISALTSRLAEPGEAVVEFVDKPVHELLPPNFNLWRGVTHPGGYSPLLLKRYYELVKDLGIADSSLGRPPFSREVWRRQRAILDLLGAKYVHADVPLDFGGLKLLESRPAFFLYQNETVTPYFTGVYSWKVIPDADKRLRYLKSGEFDPGQEAVLENSLKDVTSSPEVMRAEIGRVIRGGETEMEMEIDMRRDGIGVVRLSAYPGWELQVNGRPREWIVVNHALIGFPLEKGSHRVRLSYNTKFRLWAP